MRNANDSLQAALRASRRETGLRDQELERLALLLETEAEGRAHFEDNYDNLREEMADLRKNVPGVLQWTLKRVIEDYQNSDDYDENDDDADDYDG